MPKSSHQQHAKRRGVRVKSVQQASAGLQSSRWINQMMALPFISSLLDMYDFFDVVFTLNDLWHGATTLLSMVS